MSNSRADCSRGLDVPSSERNKKNKRQGNQCYQKRMEKTREYYSRRAEADRLDALFRKYELTTDELSEPSGDHDLILTYEGDVVAQFTWDARDVDEIPEGVVVTSDYHACFCQPQGDDFPDQLDGLFDPEPWRGRSDSVGSDCSILDIRESIVELSDVEMQELGNQPISADLQVDLGHEPPLDDGTEPDTCPSVSDGSLWHASCSMLQPGETSNRGLSPIPDYRSPTPTYGSCDNGSLTPPYRSCDYPDLPTSPPRSPPHVTEHLDLLDDTVRKKTTPSTKGRPYTASPIQLRLRNGKTLGLSRNLSFRIGWRGKTMNIYHRSCYIRKTILMDDEPIKVVLANDCCWSRFIERFPNALIIATVGGKCLGRDG